MLNTTTVLNRQVYSMKQNMHSHYRRFLILEAEMRVVRLSGVITTPGTGSQPHPRFSLVGNLFTCLRGVLGRLIRVGEVICPWVTGAAGGDWAAEAGGGGLGTKQQ